jgi:hypothetical protein
VDFPVDRETNVDDTIDDESSAAMSFSAISPFIVSGAFAYYTSFLLI